MKNEKKKFKDEHLKKKVDEMIEKSKKLNLIKSVSFAFKNNSCIKENHKGKKEFFNR